MFEIIASRNFFVLGFWVSFSAEKIIGGRPFCLSFGFTSQRESQIGFESLLGQTPFTAKLKLNPYLHLLPCRRLLLPFLRRHLPCHPRLLPCHRPRHPCLQQPSLLKAPLLEEVQPARWSFVQTQASTA